MKKFSKEQIKILKGFWKDVEAAVQKYEDTIAFIEEQLEHHLGMPVEIFHVDGEPVGIGDYDRKYVLLHMPDGKHTEEV